MYISPFKLNILDDKQSIALEYANLCLCEAWKIQTSYSMYKYKCIILFLLVSYLQKPKNKTVEWKCNKINLTTFSHEIKYKIIVEAIYKLDMAAAPSQNMLMLL